MSAAPAAPARALRLPRGRTLSRRDWKRRHAAITGFVGVQVPALAAIGVLGGQPVSHALLEVSPIVALLLVAVSGRAPRRVRALANALAALTCSAVLVHVWDGAIEAHFHFFVTIALLTFYEDWLVFGAAFAYVLGHHGLLGTLDPQGVFAHASGRRNPWGWAAIHSGFIAAQSVVAIVGWRTNEDQRGRAEELLRRARRGEREMREQAAVDQLTGLPNRRRVLELLEAEFARSDPRPLAALFVDVDGFKGINDRFGHAIGDRVLCEVADRIREAAGEEAVAGRLGGDEFLVALRVADVDAALAAGDRLHVALGARIETEVPSLRVGASIGVALSREDGDADALLGDADAAMYEAKGDPVRSVALYDEDLRRRLGDARSLERELRAALRHEELEVAYQPIVDLRGRSITAIEALARWTHPVRGPVPPNVFIPVAERSALIHDLGGWVLARAVADAARWGRAGHEVAVSVNVAPRQLSDVGFPAEVARRLREHGLPAERLWLEVTETALVADDAATTEVLDGLRSLGVRLAIDDFGAGSSTFAQLRRLPSTAVLKLDRSLIADMHVDASARALVGSVLDLARALGLTTVAEGVEDERQSTVLAELDCARAQGFLYARPMPLQRLLEVLDTGRGASATPAAPEPAGTGPVTVAPRTDAARVPARPEP